MGPADYVIITSETLAPAFESLVAEKMSRGLAARIVTTEYIYANYAGTENHDNADKIRHYVADAYAHQGTEYVLLGGDTDVIPVRGVYGMVGSIVDNEIPCDLYYAALEGTWDGDGDGIWGEANDGARGGDVDLTAEVYIGRAPVSTIAETSNFVAKTVDYDTTAQSNTMTIVLAGEELDWQTQGSVSGSIIQQSIPAGYDVVTLYDTSASKWTTQQMIDLLNSSPNLVEHLGHSNDTCNARLSLADVAGLTNSEYYFMYSQGCDAGSFDTEDVAIGEAQVVSEHGAVAVIMNSRYGWYVPGNTPGASHNFAASFWDGVLNQGILHLGQANQYAKDANRFRVQSTGMDRWIYMELNLLGDPETSLQVGANTPDGTSGQIQGSVYNDADGDGVQDSGETGLADQTVYLDSNGNGQLDRGTVTTVSSTAGTLSIPDNGTLTTAITVSGAATIADLNVTLNIAHTFDRDLDVYLISPSGTKVLLFSSVGGWGKNFTNLTLDDEAATSIDNAAAPFSGTFRGQGWLSLFDGENPNGAWTLSVSDTSICDVGKLKGWSLTFTSSEASAQTASDGSYRFGGLANGSYQVRLAPSSASAVRGSQELVQTATIAGGAAVRGIDFALASETTPPATDLGAVDHLRLSGVALGSGQTWYCVSATHSGYLTIESSALASHASVRVLLYDEGHTALGMLAPDGSSGRVDIQVEAGKVYYFSVTGSGSADLCLTNLVERNGNTVLVHGTAGDDNFAVAVGSSCQISVNGVAYRFDAASVSVVSIDGGQGNDTTTITGSAKDEQATLYPGSVTFAGSNYRIDAENTERIVIYAGGGADTASLYDSAGNDKFIAGPTYGRLSGAGYDHRVNGFSAVYAHSSTGNDAAYLYDSSGNDLFFASPTAASLAGRGYRNQAVGFASVQAYGSGGYDTAQLYDSPGDDVFMATPQRGRISGKGFSIRSEYFDAIYGYAMAGGNDVACLYGGLRSDVLLGMETDTRMTGSGYSTRARFFDTVYGYGGGGNDLVILKDSSGNDRLTAAANWLKMSYAAASIQASGFGTARVSGTQGGQNVKSIQAVNFLLQMQGVWSNV